MQLLSKQRSNLGFLIGAARARIQRFVWGRLGDRGLSPQQFWVLLMLRERPGVSLHELAEGVLVDDPTGCRVVQALEGRRLVAAIPHPRDRRRFQLALTASGRRLADDLGPIAAELRARIHRGIPAADRERACAVLGRVISNMERVAAPRRSARRARAVA